jgi:hypothetical protein
MPRALVIRVDESVAQEARRLAAMRGWRASEVYSALARLATQQALQECVRALEVVVGCAPRGMEFEGAMKLLQDAATTELAVRSMGQQHGHRS